MYVRTWTVRSKRNASGTYMYVIVAYGFDRTLFFAKTLKMRGTCESWNLSREHVCLRLGTREGNQVTYMHAPRNSIITFCCSFCHCAATVRRRLPNSGGVVFPLTKCSEPPTVGGNLTPMGIWSSLRFVTTLCRPLCGHCAVFETANILFPS